jgi:hypothetical protein
VSFARPDQRGMVSVEFALASGFALILFVLALNLVVDLYAVGAVRDALDEGARAGAPIGATAADCERRATTVVAELMPGPLGDRVAIDCVVVNGTVVARASGRLRSWVPGLIPHHDLDERAFAIKER